MDRHCVIIDCGWIDTDDDFQPLSDGIAHMFILGFALILIASSHYEETGNWITTSLMTVIALFMFVMGFNKNISK